MKATTRQGRSRWVVRLGLVLAVSVGFLVWTLVGRSQQLVIENHSGQTISSLRLSVADKKTTFERVAVGSSVTAPWKVKPGDPFTVEARLFDDTRVRLNGKLGETSHFLVLPDGHIELRPPDKKLF